MKVLRAFPPNYRAINNAFRIRGKGVIICYGSIIYNPDNVIVGPELHVHEAIHSQRQGSDPERWWWQYIGSKKFRLEEEIPAHRAEARFAPALAEKIAARLSSDLYGRMISFDEALKVIAP